MSLQETIKHKAHVTKKVLIGLGCFLWLFVVAGIFFWPKVIAQYTFIEQYRSIAGDLQNHRAIDSGSIEKLLMSDEGDRGWLNRNNTLGLIYASYGDYDQALTTMDPDSSVDYFNRGTIETQYAQTLAESSGYLPLKQAHTLMGQALDDFDISHKLLINEPIVAALTTNTTTATQLRAGIGVKYCFATWYQLSQEHTQTLKGLASLSDLITQEIRMLQQLTRDHPSQNACLKKLSASISDTQTNVQAITTQVSPYSQVLASLIKTITQDPKTCLMANNFDAIEPALSGALISVSKFVDNHQKFLTMLEQGDINQICNTASTLSDDKGMESSLQDMLSQMQQGTQQQEQWAKPQSNQSSQQSDNQTHYKDNLSSDQQKIIQDVESDTASWMQQMQQQTNQPGYKAIDSVNNLFGKFYGNTGVFEDSVKGWNQTTPAAGR